MKRKEIYKYKIQEGAYQKMASALRYTETGSAIKDNSICCITDVVLANNHYLKSHKVTSDVSHLYQIKTYHSTHDAEAFIFPNLLEELPENEWIF